MEIDEASNSQRTSYYGGFISASQSESKCFPESSNDLSFRTENELISYNRSIVPKPPTIKYDTIFVNVDDNLDLYEITLKAEHFTSQYFIKLKIEKILCSLYTLISIIVAVLSFELSTETDTHELSIDFCLLLSSISSLLKSFLLKSSFIIALLLLTTEA